MAKFRDYDMRDKELLCNLGKALSSEVRLEILELLNEKSLIIGEIARELDIPASSTAFHLKVLEQAGLVQVEELTGTRGSQKLCTLNADHLQIDLMKRNADEAEVFSVEMPVGAYSSCKVTPTCGMWGKDGRIGSEDVEYWFYRPERLKAGVLWSASGYLEYQFANGVPRDRKARKLSVSMEICSEFPGYQEDWKSDLTLWINGKDCGTFTCPGDYGARKGRVNPEALPSTHSQYGIQTVWMIGEKGSYVNGRKVSETTLNEIWAGDQPHVTVRIGNKPSALHVGGFNIFGRQFGDYDQDIILNIEYV